MAQFPVLLGKAEIGIWLAIHSLRVTNIDIGHGLDWSLSLLDQTCQEHLEGFCRGIQIEALWSREQVMHGALDKAVT